jgi:hypothetical protein
MIAEELQAAGTDKAAFKAYLKPLRERMNAKIKRPGSSPGRSHSNLLRRD